MRVSNLISVLLLAAYLPACTSFQATGQPLADLTAPPQPVNKVRVTTTAGRAIEVDAPRVVNDTLFGSAWTAGSGGRQVAEAVALPLADIRTVEVKKSDGTTTALVIVGVVGVIALLAVVSANTTESELGKVF